MKQRLIGIHHDPTYRFIVRENKKVYRKIYEELVESSSELSTKEHKAHKDSFISIKDVIVSLRQKEPWKSRIDNGQSLLAWEKHFYRSYWGRKWRALKMISVPPSK